MPVDNKITVAPPPRPIVPEGKFDNVSDVHSFLSTKMSTFLTEQYKHQYYIWQRTGGYVTPNQAASLLSSLTESKGSTGTTETTLLQSTLDGNSISVDNDFIEIEAYGSFAANGNTKQVNFYFGLALIFSSPSVAVNSGSWILQIKVIRVNSNSQKVISYLTSDNSTMGSKIIINSSSEDLNKDIIIKFTGIGTTNDDITQEGLYIKIYHD